MGVGVQESEESRIIYTLAQVAKHCKLLIKRDMQAFKGAWSRFWSKIIFPILIFTMLQKGIFNRQPKFESHLLSYKRVTELEILRYVNRVKISVLNLKRMC